MECPYCGNNHNKVKDSRLSKGGITIRRRRQCLICSTRFTTYEATGERLLPFLIVKNSGQGASIPNVKAMLSFMSGTLTVLSEETEKLIEKVDKVEKTNTTKEPDRKVLAKGAPKTNPPVKLKAKSSTSTDQVAKVIRRHIQPAEGDIFDEGLTLYEVVKDYEKRLILEALEKSNWVKTKAAKLLNINRTTLVEKIKKQNLTGKASN
jgi:transcriptional regulator NrdR family protein/DNA-binding protein Fis